MGYIINEKNDMPENITDSIKFVLCPGGVKIGRDDLQLSLLTLSNDQKQIEQGENASVKVDYKHDDNINSIWTFEHAGENHNDPYFFVEMTYGDNRPRLAYQSHNPASSTKLCAITREQSKIKRKDLVWRILPVNGE